ncbi:MAG: hypothetical protein U5J83_14645 [Bryobacterales bacterium]|nr:hypothetical protein [Bryobacterales bacterium]
MLQDHEGRRMREFIVLVRHFAGRLQRDFFGTGEGEASGGVTTVIALLLAYGICIAVFLIMGFSFQLSHANADARIEALLSARDVLNASTLALAGAFFVFLWDNLFPDRFDCHILLAQPIAPTMVLGAKLVATLGFLLVFVLAMHSLSLVVVPLVAMSVSESSLLAELAAHLLATVAAATTAFFSLAAFVSVLLLVLPYRAFQWLKAALQFSIFVVFLGQMFFSPPIEELRAASGAPLLALRALVAFVLVCGTRRLDVRWLFGARR